MQINCLSVNCLHYLLGLDVSIATNGQSFQIPILAKSMQKWYNALVKTYKRIPSNSFKYRPE